MRILYGNSIHEVTKVILLDNFLQCYNGEIYELEIELPILPESISQSMYNCVLNTLVVNGYINYEEFYASTLFPAIDSARGYIDEHTRLTDLQNGFVEYVAKTYSLQDLINLKDSFDLHYKGDIHGNLPNIDFKSMLKTLTREELARLLSLITGSMIGDEYDSTEILRRLMLNLNRY